MITVYKDRTFDFILKSPPAAVLLKKAAGIEKGSGHRRHREGRLGDASAGRGDRPGQDEGPQRRPRGGRRAIVRARRGPGHRGRGLAGGTDPRRPVRRLENSVRPREIRTLRDFPTAGRADCHRPRDRLRGRRAGQGACARRPGATSRPGDDGYDRSATISARRGAPRSSRRSPSREVRRDRRASRVRLGIDPKKTDQLVRGACRCPRASARRRVDRGLRRGRQGRGREGCRRRRGRGRGPGQADPGRLDRLRRLHRAPT